MKDTNDYDDMGTYYITDADASVNDYPDITITDVDPGSVKLSDVKAKTITISNVRTS